MIGQLRHHGRCLSLAAPRLQGPHRPAEVVTVLAEEGCRPMNPPVLREAIRLPHLPRVPVAIRAVVPLHERRVDRAARHRIGQRRLHRRGGAEDHPRCHIHHPPLLPRLVHRGIIQPLGRHLVGTPRSPPGLPVRGGTTSVPKASRIAPSEAEYSSVVISPGIRPPNRSLTSPTNSWTDSAVRSPGTTDTTSRCSGSNATWSQQSSRNRSSGSPSSQFFSFLATHDHASSIWISRVSGEWATSSSCAARACSPAARL